MKHAWAWIGIVGFFAGVLVLAGWGIHSCERRGGHMTRVAGKIWECSKW